MQKRLFSKNLFVLAFVSVLLVILTVMTGCSSDTLSATEEKKESKTENPVVEQKDVVVDEKEGWPEKFVYGILPSEDQSVMSRRYEPFQAYLEKELGMPVEFFFGTDYTAIIEALRNNHIHASHFGPFSYTLAAERANAEAFSMGVKSVEDATYTSVIVTLEGSGIETLQDLEGKNMAWVDAASTSGHLFPKALLINELGKTLDEVDAMFANATFAGGHDAALLSVLNGDTDAAGVGDFIIDTIQESHKDHPNIEKIKIIAVTSVV